MLLVWGFTFTGGGGGWLKTFLPVAGPGEGGGGVERVSFPTLVSFLLAGGKYLPSCGRT